MDGLDIYQPSTLYWKPTPVFNRAAGGDRTEQLTLRILAGFERANLSQRVLRIYVSSEADLLFLFVLDLTEADFQAIRAAENIRVDYANFPSKLIGLLEKCIACQEEDVPRFQAVLQSHGPQATFKVVENNDFKQVPHISLTFRPGSDAAVKQFLAFRLTELKSDCGQLSHELERTQSERNILQGSLTEAKRQLAQVKEQHDKRVLEFEAEARNREAAALQARTHELAELSEQHLRERAELESKYRGQLDVAEGRISELDADNRQLRELKFGLDSRVSELSHRLGTAEGSARALDAEVERLRALSQQLSRDKAERDVELGEALTRVHALEDKVETQKSVAGEQAERIRGLEASLRQVEARAEDLKAAVAGHEERARDSAAEAAKANAVVEKLSADLQTSREKVRRKSAIMSRQEEELASRDKAADEAAQTMRNLRRELEHSKEDAATLKEEVEALKGKLEESRKQLQSNEQMIRWLNNQITDTHLHFGPAASSLGVGGAARYTWAPGASGTSSSATLPLTAAAAGLGAAVPGLSGGSVPGLSSGLRGIGGTYRSPPAPSTGGTTAGSGLQVPGSVLPAAAQGTGVPAFRSSFYSSGYATAPVVPSAAAAAAPAPAVAGGSNSAAASAAPPAARASPAAPATSATPLPAAARSLDLGSLQSGSGLLGLASRAGPTYMMSGNVAVPVTSGA